MLQLTFSVFLLSSTQLLLAQRSAPLKLASSYETYELRSGARFDAQIEHLDRDTVYFRTRAGNHLRYLADDIAHGIFDVPSQGTWRPREDQRLPVSHRILLDFNLSRAEYGSEEIRGGVQVKYTPMYRVTEKALVGPMIGFAAFRADYAETVIPVGGSAAYEFNNRIGVAVDLGYGIGFVSDPAVAEAFGGMHFHPRLTVRASHPYNFFNVDFGVGYLFQRAGFERYESGRYAGERALNPAIPGNVSLDIPYERLSLSVSVTFG